MIILTLNCGSSSAKFQVYSWEEHMELIEKTLSSKELYKSRSYSFTIDNVLKKEEQELDDDEFLNEGWMDLEKLKAKIASGEIRDAKTIIAVYYATLKGLI